MEDPQTRRPVNSVQHRLLHPATVKADILFRHAMSPEVTCHEPVSGTNWRMNSTRTKKEEDTGPRGEGTPHARAEHGDPGAQGDQARLERPQHDAGDLATVLWRGHPMCPSVWRGD